MAALRRDKRRVQAEDALKYLHWSARHELVPTLESLAGALGIHPDQVVSLVEYLQAEELARLDGRQVTLTRAGHDYAVQMIRAHRLYETHLAQETGLAESAWHREADEREHDLSPAEVHALAERLGHPRFDPHGDPIPTQDGHLPAVRGRALAEFGAGTRLRIIHVEDEPQVVYEQLLALGLCAGLELVIREVTDREFVCQVEREERRLPRLAANNVSVVPLRADEPAPPPGEPLSGLPLDQPARVIALSPRCRGAERRRLMDLGVLPGTVITPELRSPGGDPVGYRIRGALVALRRDQAEFIQVMPVEEARV